MQERYLCRAKRIDNEEWVEGFYFCMTHPDGRHPHHFIIPLDADLSHGTPIEKIQIEVDPSTICQCTELKDDDGTLIFENDVLSLKDDITELKWKAVVKFGNPNEAYTWGWQLVPITEGYDGSKSTLLWVETEMSYMHCEVIGNSFDNPELVENAEEQGLHLRVPCEVGDAVYLIDKDENNKLKVYEGKWRRVSLVQTSKDGSFELCGEISYDIHDCFYNDGRTMKHGMFVGQGSSKIGEVVFLTKEEAEAKLKEMEGRHDGEESKTEGDNNSQPPTIRKGLWHKWKKKGIGFAERMDR